MRWTLICGVLLVVSGWLIFSVPKDDRFPAGQFEGTIFREATENELSQAVQVLDGSGNFLKSRDGNTYVMTARHVLDHVLTCADIKVRLNTESKPIDGTCKEIVINDQEHDIAIFKVEMFKDGIKYQPGADQTYCLDAENRTQGTKLRQYHYPSSPGRSVKTFKPGDKRNDPYASIPNHKMRVSEDCELLTGPVWCDECPKDLRQYVYWANCSGYPGSSGSGLINLENNCITGVDHVGDVREDRYKHNQKAFNSAVVALFVKKHKETLDALKIQIGIENSSHPTPSTTSSASSAQ